MTHVVFGSRKVEIEMLELGEESDHFYSAFVERLGAVGVSVCVCVCLCGLG